MLDDIKRFPDWPDIYWFYLSLICVICTVIAGFIYVSMPQDNQSENENEERATGRSVGKSNVKCFCGSQSTDIQKCDHCNQSFQICSDCTAQLSPCGCFEGQITEITEQSEDIEKGFEQQSENVAISEASATLGQDDMFEERNDALPHASKTSVLTTKDQDVKSLTNGLILDTEITPPRMQSLCNNDHCLLPEAAPTIRNKMMPPKPGPSAKTVRVSPDTIEPYESTSGHHTATRQHNHSQRKELQSALDDVQRDRKQISQLTAKLETFLKNAQQLTRKNTENYKTALREELLKKKEESRRTRSADVCDCNSLKRLLNQCKREMDQMKLELQSVKQRALPKNRLGETLDDITEEFHSIQESTKMRGMIQPNISHDLQCLMSGVKDLQKQILRNTRLLHSGQRNNGREPCSFSGNSVIAKTIRYDYIPSLAMVPEKIEEKYHPRQSLFHEDRVASALTNVAGSLKRQHRHYREGERHKSHLNKDSMMKMKQNTDQLLGRVVNIRKTLAKVTEQKKRVYRPDALAL